MEKLAPTQPNERAAASIVDAAPGSIAPTSGILDSLTRGIAVAFRDSLVRVSVRDAMRASPRTEHKIELQSFLGAEAGRRLATFIAGELGVTSRQVVDMAARLPSMDFYLSRREHRRAWTGGANVVVVATTSDSPTVETLLAYLPSGSRVRADERVLDGGRALVALHPADPVLYRVDPQPRVPGPVIEDANDGTSAFKLVRTARDGRRYETHATTAEEVRALFAAINSTPQSECVEPMAAGPDELSPMGCGGGGGGGDYEVGPTQPKLHVYRFATFGYCDHGLVCGNPEFRFKTWGPSGEQSYDLYAVNNEDDRILDGRIRNEAPSGATTIRVEIWEEDSGPDDEEGRIDLRESDFATRLGVALRSPTYLSNTTRCGSDVCIVNPSVHSRLLVNFRVVP